MPKRTSDQEDTKQQAVEVIAGLVDAFCREHLNEEYAKLCRKLTEKLARKRPSPLVSGRPNTWACGIVRTIGWVNFLDDPSQKPHMKPTTIDTVDVAKVAPVYDELLQLSLAAPCRCMRCFCRAGND